MSFVRPSSFLVVPETGRANQFGHRVKRAKGVKPPAKGPGDDQGRTTGPFDPLTPEGPQGAGHWPDRRNLSAQMESDAASGEILRIAREEAVALLALHKDEAAARDALMALYQAEGGLKPGKEGEAIGLAARHDAARKAREERAASAAARVHETLRVDTPQPWNVTYAARVSQANRKVITDAMAFLQLAFASHKNRVVDVKVRQIAKGKRCAFDENNSALLIASGSSAEDVLHETGHLIEHHFPAVRKAAEAFLTYRVGNEAARPMQDVAREQGAAVAQYGSDEQGRRDRFDLYFNVSHAYYVGRVYRKGTEVLSMMLPALRRDPVRFAALDPEYFRFAVWLLRGGVA
jgi:hypothetical protein